jgi:hypothetical protein
MRRPRRQLAARPGADPLRDLRASALALAAGSLEYLAAEAGGSGTRAALLRLAAGLPAGPARDHVQAAADAAAELPVSLRAVAAAVGELAATPAVQDGVAPMRGCTRPGAPARVHTRGEGGSR